MEKRLKGFQELWLSDATVYLSEHFLSIQGEGPSLGRIAYFLRFAGCSTRCKFCDSRYSWSKGEEFSVSSLLGEVAKFYPKFNLLVITGGEPLDQKDAFYFLGWELWNRFSLPIEVETCITSDLSFSDTDNSLFRWIISPKDQSIQEVERSTNKEMVRYLVKTFPSKVFVKPVVTNEDSLRFWMDWINNVGISKDKVYLMPEAASCKELESKSLWRAEKAVELGVNFSYRLHLQIWKGRKGK